MTESGYRSREGSTTIFRVYGKNSNNSMSCDVILVVIVIKVIIVLSNNSKNR